MYLFLYFFATIYLIYQIFILSLFYTKTTLLMIAYCAIRELGKQWSKLPQTVIVGANWIDIVSQVKRTLKKEGKNEARLSNTKGCDNQGYYINQ